MNYQPLTKLIFVKYTLNAGLNCYFYFNYEIRVAGWFCCNGFKLLCAG